MSARRALLTRRTALLGAAASALIASPGRALADPTIWVEQDVAIDGGRAPLRGTLLLPSGDAHVPAALVLAGSGPTDRNGNQPRAHNDKLKQLCRALYEQGIGTLRVDKRGVAASGPALGGEEELRFEHLVTDARSWLTRLRANNRSGPVFLIGHSEGALVACHAAFEQALAGLVLLAGPGEPLGQTIRRQLAQSPGLPQSLRLRADEILRALEAGTPVPDIPAELGALFRPSVQPYLISTFAAGDPQTALRRLELPTLVVQGTTDLQVTRDDAERLAASRKSGVDLLVIEGMNHTLKQAPKDRAAQLPAYFDPDVPLAAELVPALVRFIRQHSG